MNTQKIFNWVITGIVVILLFLVVSGSSTGRKLGVYNQVAEYFYQGLFAGTSNQFAISSTGALTTSGNVTVTTAANATSTLSVGCVATFATSSATSLKLSFNTSATTTSINGGTIQGVVVWQYGTCP